MQIASSVCMAKALVSPHAQHSQRMCCITIYNQPATVTGQAWHTSMVSADLSLLLVCCVLQLVCYPVWTLEGGIKWGCVLTMDTAHLLVVLATSFLKQGFAQVKASTHNTAL